MLIKCQKYIKACENAVKDENIQQPQRESSGNGLKGIRAEAGIAALWRKESGGFDWKLLRFAFAYTMEKGICKKH